MKQSSNCIINEMQFICDLLTQNVDGSAVILQKISDDDVNTVIYLYEVFHMIHALVSIFKIIEINKEH